MIKDNACTYKSCWEKYEKIRSEYMDLVLAARRHGETLAQYAKPEILSELQNKLETLLEESGSLSISARADLQSATTSMLYIVTSTLCDCYLYKLDPAADFNDYAINKEVAI